MAWDSRAVRELVRGRLAWTGHPEIEEVLRCDGLRSLKLGAEALANNLDSRHNQVLQRRVGTWPSTHPDTCVEVHPLCSACTHI